MRLIDRRLSDGDTIELGEIVTSRLEGQRFIGVIEEPVEEYVVLTDTPDHREELDLADSAEILGVSQGRGTWSQNAVLYYGIPVEAYE